MKMKIKKRNIEWAPVTIELTFENKSELAAWLLMNNDWTYQKDVVVEDELKSNSEFEQYDPLQANFHKLCGGDVWTELRRMLGE